MARLFDEHKVRQVRSLDGAWKFSTDEENIGIDAEWSKALPSQDTVIVPSVWNTKWGLLEYEGACWYERSFYTDGGTLRFVFGAVMTEARVYLDGEEIGYHYGGFCQFEIIARDVKAGDHTLTLRVDNSFDAQSIPQATVDWYHYGGIIRPVTLETLKGISILSERVEYELSDDLSALRARFALELYNADNEARTDTVSASVAGVNFSESITLNPGECKEIFTEYKDIPEFELWSQESPKLYDIKISTSTDDLTDRTGFRYVCVKDAKIFINSKETLILGVNRHDEHPEFGFAFPTNLLGRDLDIALDLGCNSIRGSHYPNNPVFVDMLDERGITFWSEIPIWGNGFSEEALADEVVLARAEAMHREMVKHYYNHPSIIIWGMHNEIKSETQNAYEMTKRFCEILRREGGNRLITHASNNPMRDICFAFSDIICLNMYYGWYDQEKIGGAADWEGFLENFRARRAELGLDDKPVIFSEFGAAALYGYRDNFGRIRWSEEYQSDILEHCLNLFYNDPMVAGFYVWQFCNIRTSLEGGRDRARTFNNKGILDEYRNPKLAYFTVKKLYEQFAKEKQI